MIGSYLYDKMTNDATITALVGTNIYPDFGVYGSTPFIVYMTLSEDRNRITRSPAVTIKGVADTRPGVVALNKAIYDLFNDALADIKETYLTNYIDGITIINNIEALYDSDNEKWQCSTDIIIDYH